MGAFRIGEKMDDKILEVKKEMMCIAKMRELSRMERYELAKRRSERLSESERSLLIEECQRDYESYDRIGDIRELFTFFFAGISMILSVFAIFANNKDVSLESLDSMLLMLLLFPKCHGKWHQDSDNICEDFQQQSFGSRNDCRS